MKLVRFIKGLVFFTWNMLYGYVSNLKNLWTDRDCYWNIQETFFYGDGAQEARDKYIKATGVLVEEIKRDLI